MKKISRLRKMLITLTIGKEILAAMLCTAFIPTGIVGLYGGWQLKRFLDKEVVVYNRELVRQAGRKLDYLAEDISAAQKQLIVHAISSPLFYQYEEIPLSDRIREIAATNAYLDTLRQVYPFISAIYLIDNRSRVYSSLIEFDREALLSESWIERMSGESYGYRIIPLHKADYAVASHRDPVGKTISFVRKVSRFGNSRDGTLIQIDLEERLITEFLKEYPLVDGGYVMLLDSQGQILTSSPSNLSRPQSGELREFSFSLENLDWILTAGIPAANILSGGGVTFWAFMLLILLVLASSVFFSIVVSRRITGPLRKVVGAMEDLGRGDFSRRLPDVANSDLHSLVKGINRMSDHLEILVANIARKEEEKNRARMNALQAQINPHFLYNTFDVIRGISQARGNTEVVEITASLAKVFRYSIDREEMVTIGRELENTMHYLKIQEYRFGDRFRVDYDIQDEIRDCHTLKLILQPLVENAFKYGIEECRSDGVLLIRGNRNNEILSLSVENSGPSIDREKAERLNRMFRGRSTIGEIQSEGQPKAGGFGLANVDARLKLHFGPDAGVRIMARDGGGTIVTLEFQLGKGGKV